MKKIIYILFVLILFVGCNNSQNNQLKTEKQPDNTSALSERIKNLDQQNLENKKKLSLYTMENKALKTELKKYQTDAELIPNYKKVTFNNYSFQIPSSWEINEDAEPPKNESLYIEFLEDVEVISNLRCPLLETGYEFEMSFDERDSRYYVANDKVYKFELSLMEAKYEDFRLGLVLFRPINDEPWEDSCEIGGLADFDIYRNIYSTLKVEESN